MPVAALNRQAETGERKQRRSLAAPSKSEMLCQDHIDRFKFRPRRPCPRPRCSGSPDWRLQAVSPTLPSLHVHLSSTLFIIIKVVSSLQVVTTSSLHSLPVSLRHLAAVNSVLPHRGNYALLHLHPCRPLVFYSTNACQPRQQIPNQTKMVLVRMLESWIVAGDFPEVQELAK